MPKISRYAIKKLQRKVEAQTIGSGQPDCNPAISDFKSQLAKRVEQLLAEKDKAALDSYQRELQERASSLTVAGCWEFLAQKLPEARTYGIANDLRELVYTYAKRFARDCGSIRFFAFGQKA